MVKELAFKFVPARASENPISHLLCRKKQINEEIRTLERLVRIEACIRLYMALKNRIVMSTGDFLLPVTVIEKERDDEALMPMLLPELCKKFHLTVNIVIITGAKGLFKSFKSQIDMQSDNLIFFCDAHLPHPQEVSDFISFVLEQPCRCHLILDDAIPLIYAPTLLRERLVLQKVEYPKLDSLISILLQQVCFLFIF